VFSAAVRVVPASREEGGVSGKDVATNGNAGAGDANQVDANISVTRPDNSASVNQAGVNQAGVNQAGVDQTGVEPTNRQGDIAEPTANTLVATPPPPQPPRSPSGVDNGAGNGIADGSDTGPSTARVALLTGAIAGLLLVLAGAGLALNQRRGRLRFNRTRAQLGVSPRLDLGEGACRSDDLPADGPAARFAARLDTGALRWTGGGEDG
jgi:hypothetical protein